MERPHHVKSNYPTNRNYGDHRNIYRPEQGSACSQKFVNLDQDFEFTEPALFIGGIPLQTTYDELFSYISSFGNVLSLFMPKDSHTKIIKGYAKAYMQSEEERNRVLKHSHHILHGLEVGISLWIDKSEYLNQKDRQSKRKVFVKYHPMITESDLLDYFSQFGEIKNIENKSNHLTKVPRYFCYITFSHEESAEEAASFSSHETNGKWMSCTMSKPSHVLRSEKCSESSYFVGSERPHESGTDSDFGHLYAPYQISKTNKLLSGDGTSLSRLPIHDDGPFQNMSSMNRFCPSVNTTSKDLGYQKTGTSFPSKNLFNRMLSIESDCLEESTLKRFGKKKKMAGIYPSIIELHEDSEVVRNNDLDRADKIDIEIKQGKSRKNKKGNKKSNSKLKSNARDISENQAYSKNKFISQEEAPLLKAEYDNLLKPTLKDSYLNQQISRIHSGEQNNYVFRIRSKRGRPMRVSFEFNTNIMETQPILRTSILPNETVSNDQNEI